MSGAERGRLAAVARGAAPADLYLRGGTLLNVYTGELYPANVAIKGERIAYVGLREDAMGARTRVVDVAGRSLVPGYIDPHVHVGNLVTPSAFARQVLPRGTTSVVADTLQFWALGGLAAYRAVADGLGRSPLRFYWMVRPQGQARATDEARRFPRRDFLRALAHPRTVAAGEVTRWPDVHGGSPELLGRLAEARARRLRVEGHTAGASRDKVAALAAAGITSDHEPITADEALDRARQGIAVMLRDSSLRPDLAGLLDALKAAPGLASRVMLTCDGAMPAFVAEHGFVDHLLRVALDRGVPPVDAYRMVTLNPATYFRLDDDLGGIAPGRYADVCVLADLAEPRPELVIARGRPVAEGGRLLARVPELEWSRIFTSARARLDVRWRASARDFALPARDRYPVLRLVSAVISRREDRPLAPGDLHAALVDRAGRWVAPGVVAGFAERLDGLATTLTTDFNVLALGRAPAAMARAVNRLLDRRGGIVVVEGERIVFELALPIGGLMGRRSFPEAAAAERRLREALVARGYPHHDPLFSLLFLAADFLPAIRLSPRGVWDVRAATVLLPARRRGG
jgi:adenine deaminase